MKVEPNQKTLYRQNGRQLEGKRKIPLTATEVEKHHGRHTRCELRAKEAPEHMKANWQGTAWIVELITSTTSWKGKRNIDCHGFNTNLRTTPDALLRFIRQRLSIENTWH